MRVRLVLGSLLAIYLAGTEGAVARAATRGAASCAVPLAFEENRGQMPPGAGFVARGPGYKLLIERKGFALVQWGHDEDGLAPRTEVLRLRFEGSGGAELIGEEPLARVSNFFHGTDPEGWLEGVPNFARVRMRHVYPGIDAVVYEREGLLEYDLEVEAGGDPSRVMLAIDAEIAIESTSGDLAVRRGERSFALRAPQAYQVAPDGRHDEVAARFELRSEGRVGITVGAYDPTRALVIDPVMVFSTFLGGSAVDYIFAVEVDSNGQATVTGHTLSADFPITAGGDDISWNGQEDVFVARFNAAGNQLLWSTFLGGDNVDLVRGLTLDVGGNVYLAGTTRSGGFPVTAGAFQTQHRCSYPSFDPFVAKLSPHGALLYVTYLGGCGEAVDVAANDAGEAYVVGHTLLGDHPLVNPYQGQHGGGANDLFISRLNAAGSALLYSTYLGGSGDDVARGIGVSYIGQIIVTCVTSSQDFPTKAMSGNTVPQASHGGGTWDAAVTMFEAATAQLRYSTYLGGSADDAPLGLHVGSNGYAFVVGETRSADLPVTATSFGASPFGGEDGFLARVKPENGQIPLLTYIGGSGGDDARGAFLDSSNNVVVVGETCSDDFPVRAAIQPHRAGDCDAFIMTVPPTGLAPLFSTYLGGGAYDVAEDVALHSDGSVFVAGYTRSTDFPTKGAVQGTYGGSTYDGFLAKISAATSNCTMTCSATVPGTSTAGNPVSFLGAATPSSACTGYLSFDWDFGDGSAHSAVHDPTHTYTAAGTYTWTFTASVTDGSCTKTGTIAVSSASCTPPTIVAQPQNAVVPSGSSVTLRVGASGTLPLSYQWYEGTSGITTTPVTGATASVLAVPSVTQTRQYWARVGNACGSVNSVTATVSPLATGTTWSYLIPAVAHNKGLGGTLWRTDVGILNVSGATVTMHVTFFHVDGYPLAPIITSQPANTMRMWWNVLESLIGYGASDNASGALLIHTSGPLNFTSRTYNSTSTGTYGQFVPAVTLGNALQPGQTGYLPQLRSSSNFRTNIGLVNLGPADARVVITLYDRDANLVGTRTVTLIWSQWWQWTNAYGGATYEPAFAKIEVQTGGAVWAYASVVDNRTGDATTVPVQLP